MALSIEYDGKLTRIAVTSSTVMIHVLESAKEAFSITNGSNRSFLLLYRKCPIDLSMPFRLTGIPNLATLEMKRNDTTSKTDKTESGIRISVQLADGKRKTTTANKNNTFHAILTEMGLLPSPYTFGIQFMQQEIQPEDFGALSLQDFGITNGSALLRVRPCDAKSNSNEIHTVKASGSKVESAIGVSERSIGCDRKEEIVEQDNTEGMSVDCNEEPKISSDLNENLHEENCKKFDPAESLNKLRQNCFDIVSREAVLTLMKIVTNVLSQPDNQKLRSLRLSNARFHSNVGRHPGGIEFLCSLGFEINDEAGILQIPFDKSDLSDVTHGLDLLQAEADDLNIEPSCRPKVVTSKATATTFDVYKSQIIRIETQPRGESMTERFLNTLQAKKEEVLSAEKIARNTTILMKPHCSPLNGSEVAAGSDQSDSQIIIQSSKARRDKLEKEQNFRTRGMRELDSMRQRRIFTKTLIRVQFPDRVILQAQFHSAETVNDLVTHIRECLDPNMHPEESKFYLFTTPARQRLRSEDTLLEANLVPAAMIHLSWEYIEAMTASTLQKGFYLRKALIEDTTSSDVAMDTQPEYPRSIVLDPSAPVDKVSSSKAGSKNEPDSAKKSRKPAWLKL